MLKEIRDKGTRHLHFNDTFLDVKNYANVQIQAYSISIMKFIFV